jgi:hypothetical protein
MISVRAKMGVYEFCNFGDCRLPTSDAENEDRGFGFAERSEIMIRPEIISEWGAIVMINGTIKKTLVGRLITSPTSPPSPVWYIPQAS